MWQTVPTPARWWFSPVSSDARVGEHIGLTWKLTYRRPSAASRSTCGVSISEPKQPTSLKPKSSTSTTSTLGAPSDAAGGRVHAGVDVDMMRPTSPLNPS